ncbi:MAG TPA: BrnT family toxin [Candidatus Binataceae bacterium]|nr:BrnT family toxin [Candidatus Binataceae bacterium]
MGDAPLFAWDEAKSSRNRAERGFGFDYACRIFAGPVIEEEHRRRDYGERRIVAMGKVGTQTFAVVFAWRGNRRRIISARPAKRRERDAYRQAFPQ